jgi:hypothetical protein
MSELAPIIEMDLERDKREFLVAIRRNETSLREIADWCATFGDKHKWTNAEICKFAGKGERWSQRLRKWRAAGFVGDIWQSGHTNSASVPTPNPLKSKDNSERSSGSTAVNSNKEEIPSEEEAEESHQQALYDQACLFLERMTGETRQRFFAHLRRKYNGGHQ